VALAGNAISETTGIVMLPSVVNTTYVAVALLNRHVT
jgi:hypothetical protein